jgi:hypothetical protein
VTGDGGGTVLQAVTAVGVLLTGLGTLRVNYRGKQNHQVISEVREEVRTHNGATIGNLVEQNLPPSFDNQVATLDPRPDQNTAGKPPVGHTPIRDVP